MPPGQAKKVYVIGEPLIAEWQPVPVDLVTHLHPIAVGYRYVRVDDDVLLINEGTKKVVDAITLFSAVNR